MTVYGTGQGANAWNAAKPIAETQHGNGLINGLAVTGLYRCGQLLAGRGCQPGDGAGRVMASISARAQTTQHGAGLNRCQLILVTEQYQTTGVWKRIQ